MDWSYIACFIDTDGCLGTSNNLGYIGFTNTNKKVLEIIKKYLEAKNKITTHNPTEDELGKKISYAFRVNRQIKVKEILEKVVNKMIIKQRKARKLLVFVNKKLETMRPESRIREDGRVWCSKCRRWLNREKFYLNKKGELSHIHYCKDCYAKYRREQYRKNYSTEGLRAKCKQENNCWICWCPKCQRWLPIEKFDKRNRIVKFRIYMYSELKTQIFSYCKECKLQYKREWYHKNKERIKKKSLLSLQDAKSPKN